MNIKALVFLGMIFMHILDDFHLQGILASMKQKSYWEKNAPDKKYKNDYMAALFIHGIEWGIMVMIPMILYYLYIGIDRTVCVILMIIFYGAIHAGIDDMKANYSNLNLIQDQMLHLFQITVLFVSGIILIA